MASKATNRPRGRPRKEVQGKTPGLHDVYQNCHLAQVPHLRYFISSQCSRLDPISKKWICEVYRGSRPELRDDKEFLKGLVLMLCSRSEKIQKIAEREWCAFAIRANSNGYSRETMESFLGMESREEHDKPKENLKRKPLDMVKPASKKRKSDVPLPTRRARQYSPLVISAGPVTEVVFSYSDSEEVHRCDECDAEFTRDSDSESDDEETSGLCDACLEEDPDNCLRCKNKREPGEPFCYDCGEEDRMPQACRWCRKELTEYDLQLIEDEMNTTLCARCGNDD